MSRPVDRQSEQWPHRTAGWHTPDYDPRVDGYPEELDRPSASDLAAEQDYHYSPEEFEREGYEEPPKGEHGDPGFREEEVDDWHDPDHGREDHRHAVVLPDPPEGHHLSPEDIHRMRSERADWNDDWGGGTWGDPESRFMKLKPGTSSGEQEGQPMSTHERKLVSPVTDPWQRNAPQPQAQNFHTQDQIRDEMNRPHQMVPPHKPTWPPPQVHQDKAEDFDNMMPTMDTRGHTQVPGAIDYHPWFTDREVQNIRYPRRGAKEHERTFIPDNGARIIRDEESGLGYDVIAVPNPKGDGWDVVRHLKPPSFPQE